MSIFTRVIILTLFFLVFVIGLIGNGLLIFIVFRQKNLRTVPNLLVVSLALGDFLFVLFCVPFGAVAYSLDYYPFSTIYCRFENFIINLSLGVSVFSLLALSADRYKIIVKPFSSHANDPSIKLKTVVISIWLLSILFALPETIQSGLIKETMTHANNETVELIYCWSPNRNDLLSNRKFMIIRQILRLIIYYLMPLIFVSIFYILIAKHLFQTKSATTQPLEVSTSKRGQLTMKSTSPSNCLNNHVSDNKLSTRSMTLENEKLMNTRESLPGLLPSTSSSSSLTNNIRRSRDHFYGNSGTNNNNNNTLAIHTLYQDVKTRKQLRARHKVAKTVLFLCSVFFICWLPKQIHDLYWFIGVILYSAPWNHFWHFNKTLALILSYIYSCINPFALYFLSSTFRHFYKRYLFFWTHTSCCYSKNHHDKKNQRSRTGGEMTTLSEYTHRSSTNNMSTIYYDLNRMKTSNCSQQGQHSIKMQRFPTSERTSTASAIASRSARYSN